MSILVKHFGSAGHFICGRWCRFHLCTQAGKYLISTVGEYVHPRHSGMSEKTEQEWLAKNPYGEQIGCDRLFETMVFVAGKPCKAKDCDCGMPEISGSELECLAANTRGEATRNHEKMVNKYWRRACPKKTTNS